LKKWEKGINFRQKKNQARLSKFELDTSGPKSKVRGICQAQTTRARRRLDFKA